MPFYSFFVCKITLGSGVCRNGTTNAAKSIMHNMKNTPKSNRSPKLRSERR